MSPFVRRRNRRGVRDHIGGRRLPHMRHMGVPLVMPQSRPDDVWHDLVAFDTCVRLAAAKRN